MPQVKLPSGVEIEYESMGDPTNPTMLWIMGFTAQMISWHDDFMRLFVDAGWHVVRFDNRDCGLSTKFDGVDANVEKAVMAAMMGDPAPEVPYTLSDMAADAMGVLDALGVERAHIIGASMGGMIAQTVAIEHPHRTISLTSIMSTVGDLAYGTPTEDSMALLTSPPPSDRAAFIESAKLARIWCSKRWFDENEAMERTAREYDRSFYPEGASRQMAAIYASGDRSDKLRTLDVPTLVIHGRDDRLLQPSGGERTAELVPGAALLMLNDMGHDVPRPLWPVFLDSIDAHARRAS